MNELNSKLPIIEEGKKYHASNGEIVVFIQPSAKHIGYWWVCKIECGTWEGFIKPIAQAYLDFWAKQYLPEDLNWIAEDWTGDEMTIPLDNPLSSKDNIIIYFVEAVGLERVKIGLTSGSPTERLSQLQLLSPVELRVIGQMAGSYQLEKELHKRFIHLHIRGEWFHLNSEIQSYVEENAR